MKALKTLGYLFLFFAINFLCKRGTDDFCVTALLQPDPQTSQWNLSCDPDNLSSIVQQKFFYLTKGSQAYVFVSEDGAYIFKLFKPLPPVLKRPSYQLDFSSIPLAQSLFSALYPKACAQERQLDFQSHFNAFTLLREETGLLYLHLTQTEHLKRHLTFYDKIGIRHAINLDKTCFLIQKRTKPFYATLKSCMQNQQQEIAKDLLKSYVHLATQCVDLGFIHHTTSGKNFGCLGTQALIIDTGRLLQAKAPVSKELSSLQLAKTLGHLKAWLMKQDPSLSNYLDILTQTSE